MWTVVYGIITIHYPGNSAITTTTRQTKDGEIKRTISVSFALADTCEARATETHGYRITTDTYLLSRQPSDFGIAFRVRKCHSAESYDVLLNQPGGGHSCDCRWGVVQGAHQAMPPSRNVPCRRP